MPLKKTESNEYLSTAAMDFYARFGKNRGLEKFLISSSKSSKALRNNRASSDSSLNEKNECQDNENISHEFAKSLNNLKISDCDIEKSQSHETTFRSEVTDVSDKDVTETSYEEVVTKSKPAKQAKVVIQKPHTFKETSTMTENQLPIDKNVNLSLQSKIEIMLPPQLQQQADVRPKIVENERPEESKDTQKLPVPSYSNYNVPPHVPQFFPTPKILYSTDTQTSVVQDVEVPDEPIQPDVRLSVDFVKPDDLESSPNESVTSRGRLGLEWDSLGDVGYEPFLICDKSALSSTERKALKSYLYKKGLHSTQNIIVFKNSPGKQDSPKTKQRPERRRSLTYNDNWMEVYTKYKDKYAMDAPKTVLKPFKPEAQSTPLDRQCVQLVEKSAQTSLINLLCKSIQVESETRSEKDGSSQSSNIVMPESLDKIPVQSFGEGTNQTECSLETGSFVFIAGSPKKNKSNSDNASPKTSITPKKQSPKKKRSLTGVFESQTSVKVSTLQSTIATSDNSERTNSSDESTFKKPTSFDEELKMAFALMSSVVESKTMPNEMKKSLINKIMQRIVGLKIVSQEDNISQKNQTKDKSSSVSSIPVDTSSEKHISSTKETISEDSSNDRSKSDKIVSTVKSHTYSVSNTESDSAKINVVDDFVKQTLKPMTHSEVDYENHKASHSSSFSSGKNSSKDDSSVNRGPMNKKVEQLLTIEKEIERLIKLKDLIKFDMKKRKEVQQKIYENVDDVRVVQGSKESIKNAKKNERSRLCTPTSEQNLTRDLLQRKDKFVELYENQCGKLYEVPGPEVIYTKPYGTRESVRSEAKTVVISRNSGTRSTKTTSIASSDILSSRSISVPMGGNTVTNTSTHQYDIERLPNPNDVETQTTDTLKRQVPIFENVPKNIKTSQKTRIIDMTKLNKQIQTTCPQPIAYSIVFDNQKTKPRTQKDSDNKLEKETHHDEYDVDTRTLKEHLNAKRPEIRHTMDERNECIKELRKLRQLRNEQRKKLLLLTSETSLKEKIRNLPPAPLAQKRLFSTRALKLHSLKQYQNLPEVQKRKEVEMVNNLKKKNRFLLDLFNKNLQRKVLKGQTDVSYSVNLFTNG